MAVSFQQRSRWRKLIYGGVIVLLGFGMVVQRMQWLQAAAETNNLQEVNIGEVDLGGSAARYALVSLRGPLICGLWWEAHERQIKHDWPQVELIYKMLTKLQPHFRNAWKYRAWNIAYNVSVECDRIQDKYFFIAEGTQLLTEGEKLNRAIVRYYDPDTGNWHTIERGEPNLRWDIGHMIQNKMTVADEAKTYHVLLQMSCIHPNQRDPAKLRLDPDELDRFKKTYPRLVRRVRDLRRIPEEAESQLDKELLSMLATYRRVPYHDPSQLEDTRRGFIGGEATTAYPIWPDRMKPDNVGLEENQDECGIAYTWYTSAQEPLPRPNPDPGPFEPPPRSERRYKVPEGMSIFIFRGKPAQTLSWKAIYLAKEGWFEESKRGWEQSYAAWKQFGLQNGLDPHPKMLRDLEERAKPFRKRLEELAKEQKQVPSDLHADPTYRESFKAHEQLDWMERNRHLAHYDHWVTRSATELTDPAVNARRHFYNAGKRWRADLYKAREEYEKGIKLWEELMVKKVSADPNQWVHTPFGRDKQNQEEIIELQEEYLKIRAKCDAPAMIRQTLLSWEISRLGELTGQQAAGSPLQSATGFYVPAGTFPLTIDRLEALLEGQPGPLDQYFERGLARQVGLHRNEPAAPPTPSPGQQPTLKEAPK